MERKKMSSHRISRTHLPLSLSVSFSAQSLAVLSQNSLQLFSPSGSVLLYLLWQQTNPVPLLLRTSSQSQPSMAMTHLGTRTHISLPLTLNISSRLCKGTKLCVCLRVLGRQHQQPGDTPVKPALNTNNHTDTSEQLDSSLAWTFWSSHKVSSQSEMLLLYALSFVSSYLLNTRRELA